MSGWDGAGNFTLPYSWVVDAGLGVKISSSKMDTQFGTVSTGLINVLCRDGQNSPSANIPWNNKKITGLAAGTAPTDAANVGQIQASDWVIETASLTYISGNVFKVLGANYTSRYTVGRKLKATVTAGTAYCNVRASSYSAPDTTVTVDGGNIFLDSGLSAVSYGLVSPASDSTPVGTTIMTWNLGTDQTIPSSSTTTLNFNTLGVDLLNETAAGAGTFTPTYSGVYQFNYVLSSSASPVAGWAIIRNEPTPLIPGTTSFSSYAFLTTCTAIRQIPAGTATTLSIYLIGSLLYRASFSYANVIRLQ